MLKWKAERKAPEESTVEAHKLGRRMTISDRRVTARSAQQIWKWLKFLVNKFGGFLKHLKSDLTTIAQGWRPFPILARIELLDLRRATPKDVEVNADLNPLLSAAPPGGEDPRHEAAETREEETSTITMSPRKSKRRWTRRVTVKVSRKRQQKRRMMDIDNEARRTRLTRKRRRISRGWVKQQFELSREETPAAGGASERRSSLPYSASSHVNGNSNPEVHSAPDLVSPTSTRPEDSSSQSTALVGYHNQSRNKQKSTPPDGKVERLLPDELVEKVLTWLPVTSVFRFRAVCKRWQYILSGQGWRKIFHKPPVWNGCTSFFSSGKGRRQLTFFDESEHKWSRIDLDFLPRPACRLLAASGGLLCLCFAGMCSCLYICNPATKTWRELPEFYHKRRRAGTMLVHLLVDKVTLSYKVIVVGYPSSSSPQSAAEASSSTFTEVYDSQTDKWTALANVPASGCVLAPSMAFRNGILYCLTEHPTGLLAFNIARKVWRRLEIKSHSRVLCILEYNGHILIVARLTARVTRLGIWKLRESFPRVWIKVALMPVEHALYFFLSGKFQCFSHGNFICFASPRRPRWLLFDITTKLWKWGIPAGALDPDSYNKWFFYEPRLDITV